MKKIALYIPVLHEGYRLFLEENSEAEELYVFDRQLLKQLPEFEELKKDIRGLDSDLIAKMIESLGFDFKITTIKNIEEWNSFKELIKKDEQSWILSNDDFGHYLVEKVLADQAFEFSPIFLRWDKNLILTEKDPEPTEIISRQDFEKEVMKNAFSESNRSSDWWRQVGVVIIKDGEVLIVSHNRHLPSENTLYINGEPRIYAHAGKMIEITSSIHAEALAIARAARQGIALDGADLYVTTFPCPVCAKQIAMSGIKRLFYATGYAVLDGKEVMAAAGIEIIEVQFSHEEKKILAEKELRSTNVKECYV
jgi:dCMP deaminase